jgi:MazG-like nucleotide pyrophosphohydrolase family protein
MQFTLLIPRRSALADDMEEFFDDEFPPGEQIPRYLNVTLRAAPGPFGEVVKMTVNGFPIGNSLTDNARTEMGYRWHDTLHLAHAVCLGWSPVLRSLAGLKRRSDALADHVEDGGRAIVADESIAWAVFCNARKNNWYGDRSPDLSLLEWVHEMTYALEVSVRTHDEWQHAIRTGIGCLRSVWLHGGGILLGDLAARSLVFAGQLKSPAGLRCGLAAGPISAGNGSPLQREPDGTAA